MFVMVVKSGFFYIFDVPYQAFLFHAHQVVKGAREYGNLKFKLEIFVETEFKARND